MKSCPDCNGKGTYQLLGPPKTCESCKGTGIREDVVSEQWSTPLPYPRLRSILSNPIEELEAGPLDLEVAVLVCEPKSRWEWIRNQLWLPKHGSAEGGILVQKFDTMCHRSFFEPYIVEHDGTQLAKGMVTIDDKELAVKIPAIAVEPSEPIDGIALFEPTTGQLFYIWLDDFQTPISQYVLSWPNDTVLVRPRKNK